MEGRVNILFLKKNIDLLQSSASGHTRPAPRDDVPTPPCVLPHARPNSKSLHIGIDDRISRLVHPAPRSGCEGISQHVEGEVLFAFTGETAH